MEVGGQRGFNVGNDLDFRSSPLHKAKSEKWLENIEIVLFEEEFDFDKVRVLYDSVLRHSIEHL